MAAGDAGASTIFTARSNELFSEVNFRHPAVLKALQNVNGLTKKDKFSVIL
jgi:hypothetical protein